MIGFGSIGQGTLPLIIKHIGMPAAKITVLTGPDCEEEVQVAAKRYGIKFEIGMLLEKSYKELLEKLNIEKGMNDQFWWRHFSIGFGVRR